MAFLKVDAKDVSAGTIHVLLNRLVEDKKIVKIGRGLFSLSNAFKPQYIYTQSNAEIELSTALLQKFPFVSNCVWKANAIAPFMQHVPSMSFVRVDVERITMESVFQYLQRQYPENMILLNPSQCECERYINIDNIIIVRPLIAETPLSSYKGINRPAIEKILVDIVSDKEFDYVGGFELHYIFSNVFESVDVNKKKLLRYASRRNKKEKIEHILRSNNL
ncbi:MAG: hypothetical protein K2H44_01415 [Muribaculaceae bacterium]|nr:hypothetical protein [Muribaculaceae bacterium]